MLGHYDRKHTVVYLDDEFDKQTEDVVWLDAITQWDPVPVVVSGDGRILKNPAELQVLKGLPLTFFLLAEGWTQLPWADFAWKAIKVWPEIVQFAAPRKPSIFRVPVNAQKIEFRCYTSDLGKIRGKK